MFFLKNYNNSFFQINYQAFLVDVFGRPKSFHGGHDNEDEVWNVEIIKKCLKLTFYVFSIFSISDFFLLRIFLFFVVFILYVVPIL
jgi:hypothetical protein